MELNQFMVIALLFLSLSFILIQFAINIKTSGLPKNIVNDLITRSSITSSASTISSKDYFGFKGGKGNKNLLATVPTYGLVGFLFTFSLVAWSYLNN